MKVWDVRRASGSLFTLDQHNGDKSKASSEAGTVIYHFSSLVHLCSPPLYWLCNTFGFSLYVEKKKICHMCAKNTYARRNQVAIKPGYFSNCVKQDRKGFNNKCTKSILFIDMYEMWVRPK